MTYILFIQFQYSNIYVTLLIKVYMYTFINVKRNFHKIINIVITLYPVIFIDTLLILRM